MGNMTGINLWSKPVTNEKHTLYFVIIQPHNLNSTYYACIFSSFGSIFEKNMCIYCGTAFWNNDAFAFFF